MGAQNQGIRRTGGPPEQWFLQLPLPVAPAQVSPTAQDGCPLPRGLLGFTRSSIMFGQSSFLLLSDGRAMVS